MKKIISLVLAILLVACSFPMLSMVASATEPTKALHVTAPGGSVWRAMVTNVKLNASTEYTFAFTASTNMVLAGDTTTTASVNTGLKTYNGNAAQLNNDNLCNVTATLEDCYVLSDNPNYKRFTYKLETPSSVPTSGILLGVVTNLSNYYLLDMILVDEDDEEVAFNGKFESGLDHWCYGFGDDITSFEGGTTGLGKTYYKTDDSTLEVVPLAVSPTAMDEPAAPNKMIYYTNTAADIFANRFTAEAGKMYYLSFGIASTADISKIGIGAYGDGDRKKVSINPQFVSRIKHDNYYFVTYSVTMPADLSSVADNNWVYLGVAISANAQSYIFNMNVYDPYTTQKTNLFTNASFAASINCTSVGQWTAIPSNNSCSEGSFVTEVQSDSVTRPIGWTSTGKELRLMDYDATKFPSKKMLYFETGSSNSLILKTRVPFVANTAYDLSFSLSRNVPKDGGFAVVFKANDYYNGSTIASPVFVNSVDHGEYITYNYTVTAPSSVSDSLSFLLFYFPNPRTGYLLDCSLTKQGDTSKVNQIDNGLFGLGLNSWSCGTDAWFISGQAGVGKTSYSRADGQKLIVKNFSTEEISKILPKNMLHYSGKVSGDDKSNIGKKVTLQKGHTYTVNFDFHAFEGGLDSTCYLTLNKMATRDSKICVDAPIVADFLVENNQFIRNIDTINNTATFTFTLSDSLASGLPNSGTYALCFTSRTTQLNTDMYVSNMVMYDVADSERTNILGFNNYTSNLSGWVAYWDVANENATSFTQQGCTVKIENYDETKFPTEKKMLYFKETKKDGFDVFLQKIKSLEANVEYTISMDYYFMSGAFDETFYFGLYGGPGEGDMVYKTQYRSSKESVLSGTFDTTVDTGKNIKFTFTLTQEEIDKNTKYYAGLYLLPDPDMITEMYIADLKIYKTDDTQKTNYFADNEYSTKISNWYANYGGSYMGSSPSTIFSRGDIEFTAKYVPYVADYFATPDLTTHYGDANADGKFNIIDLVALKKNLANKAAYFVMADANADASVNASDITKIVNMLIGTESIGWTENVITLDEFNAVGGADSQATTLKNTILNSANDVTPSGTTYYISNDGNDNNDGKSTSTPIKTIAKLKLLSLNSGDIVLFRRGDTFRTNEEISVNSGVTYSAYGTGAKPKIYGSVKNYADSSCWTTTDGNIWVTDIDADYAANVVFNDGESVGYRKNAMTGLTENGDFYFNNETSKLYLFMNQVNPGVKFDSIEISSSEYLFYGIGSDASSSLYMNIKISNLDLRYAATHAIYLAFVQDININNCAIGWAGGEYQSGTNKTVRLGNAIQLWRIAKDTNVSNNYLYQAFDAAITFQGTGNNQYTGLTLNSNLIEYCSMNFEFWANNSDGDLDTGASLKDITFNNNILRFGGMGFGGLQRSIKGDQAYILAWNSEFNAGQIDNFQIQNNIFDIANSNYYYSKNTDTFFTMSGNTYYQKSGSAFQIANGYNDYATNSEEFDTAIKKIDATATTQWVA